MSGKKKAAETELVIPDKLYFRIGEVARLAGLPAYVLRFWQTEFPQLKPVKSNTGQRMYRQRDVELVLRIKKLLHEEGFTIAGARDQLKRETSPGKTQMALALAPQSRSDGLKRVRQGLRDILSILNTPIAHPQARKSGVASQRAKAAPAKGSSVGTGSA